MDQDLRVNEEGQSSPIHSVLGVADGVYEFIPDKYETYVVHVRKGQYHKTKMCVGVAFEVEVEFDVEVGGRRSY